MEQGRQVLGHLVYGIYLLTTRRGDEINGMPLSWATQVSFDPPLVAICVKKERYSNQMIKESGVFAVHLLESSQQDHVFTFQARDMEKNAKFSDHSFHPGQTGVPILDDCIGYIECRVVESIEPGDHTIFIGKIEHGGWIRDGRVLSEDDLGQYYSRY